jgi:hypothetical protein
MILLQSLKPIANFVANLVEAFFQLSDCVCLSLMEMKQKHFLNNGPPYSESEERGKTMFMPGNPS